MRSLISADDVTEQDIIDALEIVDGWYSEGPIDWEDVWDRLERTGVDMGNEWNSGAMRKIKREVRKRLQYG